MTAIPIVVRITGKMVTVLVPTTYLHVMLFEKQNFQNFPRPSKLPDVLPRPSHALRPRIPTEIVMTPAHTSAGSGRGSL